MASRVWYDTAGIPNAPTWVQESQWSKIRVVAGLHKPVFFEIWVADPGNVKQNAGTYSEYQRIRIDFERNGAYSNPLIGRIEYIDAKNDDETGQHLVLQCKDFSLELLGRIPEHDFTVDIEAETGGATLQTRAQLIERIIQYCCYTQIGFDNLLGGSFSVATAGTPSGNTIQFEDGGLGGAVVATARIVAISGSHMAIDRVVNVSLSNEIADNDGIRELNASGAATGVTALVNVTPAPYSGSLYRTINTTQIETVQSLSVMDGANCVLGKYLGNYTNALDLIQDIALGDYNAAAGTYVYDLVVYSSNSTQTDQDIRYFRRGSEDSGIDISYNTAETATVKPMLPDYVFPKAPKEGATHVVVDGLSESEKTLTTKQRLDSTAIWNTKIFKDNKKFIRGNVTTDLLDDVIDAEYTKTRSFDVQRGTVRIAGYPFTGAGAIPVWPGSLTTITMPNIAAVNGTDMMIVSIDYEEPPGIATIDLVGTGRGQGEDPWKFAGKIQKIDRTSDESYLRRNGIERRSNGLSYTDDSNNVSVVSESLYFRNSSDVEQGRFGHRQAAGGQQTVRLGTSVNVWLDVYRGGLMFSSDRNLWPYSNSAAALSFYTRQQDGTTVQDHMFSPLDNGRGILGDASHYWDSLYVEKLYVSSLLSGAIAYGTAATNASGDTGDIAHGLGSAPSAIMVTPAGTLGDLFATVHTVGATNFRVKVQRLGLSTAADGGHSHTADGTLASATAGDHTHVLGGSTEFDPGAGNHQHTLGGAGGGVATLDGDHTHDVTGSTASEANHTHGQTLDAPGVTTVYWVAFK